MFKFGKYTRPVGPYDKYKEPFNSVPISRNRIVTASKTKIEADSCAGGGGGFGFGGSSGFGSSSGGGGGAGFIGGAGGPMTGGNSMQSGYNNDRFNPVYDQLEEGTVLEDWMPRDGAGLDALFRRIYLRDPTIGPGIDIIRSLPWSDFNLEGIDDPAILRIYQDCMEALQVQLLMPDITGDYLILGRNIVSLIFDARKGIFSGVVPHDPDFIRVTPLPVYGFDPLCDFKLSPGFKRFLNSTDPRAVDARKALPPTFLEAANKEQGFLPLDPVSTIYLARKASQHDSVGTSLLTRVLYFWAIEKALLNAQLTSTRRRARSFMHLVAGIDNVWEPTAQELDSLAGMLIQANEDPVGGVVATRTGVTISEPVGGGADFYKWSDELELFSKYKMQAIGINDALLSGDACMVGSTLLPTNKGIVRLGDLGTKEGPEWQDLDLIVASRYKNECTKKWLYNGHKETLLIETSQGNSIQCTFNHPVLVLNEEGITEWKRAEHLLQGDILCLSSKKCVRTLPLEPLNLPDPVKIQGPQGTCKKIRKPEYMTTDLAFLLGVIISEGTFYKNQVRIGNTDENLLNKCSEIFKNIFDIDCQTYLAFDPETDLDSKRWSRKKSWEIVASSKTLVEWLNYWEILKEGDSPAAYRKSIPDCILQATEDIWLAYLAGHIEGDGCFGQKLNIKSFSPLMIQQLAAMFNAMGYLPKIYPNCIELNSKEAKNFYSQCAEYMVNKKPKEIGGTKARNRFGIPWDYWQKLIKDRFVKSNSRGIFFINDEAQEIFIPSCSTDLRILQVEKRLVYDRFEAGAYSKLLEIIKEISFESFKKLNNLLECRHHFTEITEITESGVEDVYDISMNEGVEPAFVANGLIVHNTYSNADSARSVFVESLATLRSRIVNKFFYQKLFPIIARIHGFQKRTKAEIDHNIRVNRSSDSPEEVYQRYVRSKFPEWAQASAVTAQKLTQRKAMQIPASDLIMPTINWAKQLKPNQDEVMLNILEKLQQNEVPVTLSQWAMAAGLDPNVDKMRKEHQKDAILRKDLERFKTEQEEIVVPQEEGGIEEEIPTEEGAEPSTETPEKAPTETPEEAGDEAAKEEQVQDLIDEMTTMEPSAPEEVKQSIQAKLVRAANKVPKKVSDIPIWYRGKCGVLRRSEASLIITNLIKEQPTLVKKPAEVIAYFKTKTTSAEKVKILSYLMNRLNICALPVVADIEKTILVSAKYHLARNENFESKKALLDLRKFEAEMQFLSKVVGKTKETKGPQLSLNKLMPNMGARVFGGY